MGFYYLFMSFFSSRHMPELRFAITQQQKSVLTGSIYDGPLTQVLATLAALAEGSLTHSIHSNTKSTLPVVWMNEKASSPCLNFVLSQCFLAPLGVLLVMKTLDNEWHIVIKVYKLTVLEIWRDFLYYHI